MRKIRKLTKPKYLLEIEDTVGWKGAYAAMDGVESRSTTRAVFEKSAEELGKAGLGQAGKGDVDMGERKRTDRSGDKGARKGVGREMTGDDKGEDKNEDVDGRAGSGGEKLIARIKGKATTAFADKGLKSSGKNLGGRGKDRGKSTNELDTEEEEEEKEKEREKAPRSRNRSQLKKPVVGK